MNKKYILSFGLVVFLNANSELKIDNFNYIPSKEFQTYFSNCDNLLNKKIYLNCYNHTYKSSTAVAYELKKELLMQHINKRPKFEPDFKIAKKYRTYWEDYLHSGFDRGHILSNQSMNFNKEAQRLTFLMSNITAQYPTVNRGVWLKAEKLERQLAIKYDNAEVLNLIEYSNKTIKNNIRIPSAYIKIIKTNNSYICFNIPNKEKLEKNKLKDYKIDCNIFLK